MNFFEKTNRIIIVLSTFILILLMSGCGFQLKHNIVIDPQFKYLQFYSNDRYGILSREIYKIFKANNVTIVNEESFSNKDKKRVYPAFHIENQQLETYVTSVYPDGKSAESQMMLVVNARMVINGETYPLKVKVLRTFFDNPATPLAKSAEQDLIQEDMYKQAAEQLIQQFKTIMTVPKK